MLPDLIPHETRLKAAIELVTRSGFEVASSSVKYEGVRELSYLFLK
jgi:hypothetical protein